MEIYIFSFMLMGIQAEVQQVASSSNLPDLVHSRYKPEIPGVENDGKLGGIFVVKGKVIYSKQGLNLMEHDSVRDPVCEDGVFHLTIFFREKRGVTQTC